MARRSFQNPSRQQAINLPARASSLLPVLAAGAVLRKIVGKPTIDVGQRTANQLIQLYQANRLAEHLIGVHLASFAPNLVVQFGAHQHARWAHGRLFQITNDLQPTQPGHVEIDDGEVKLGAGELLDRFFAVPRRRDMKSPPRQPLAEGIAKRRIIVGYEQTGDYRQETRPTVEWFS